MGQVKRANSVLAIKRVLAISVMCFLIISCGGEVTTNTSKSDGDDITVQNDTASPSVPTGLTSTVITALRVDLIWNASTDNVGVNGYRIYRNGIEMGTTANTSYSDTNVLPSTSYNYVVLAYDLVGNESAQSVVYTATTGALPPVGSFYISPTGTDGDLGTSTQPWRTFSYAFANMGGGSTLVLKDGTYSGQMVNPPSGTSTQYTRIMAENDGGAIVDGSSGSPVYPNGPLVISSGSYIRIEGIKFVNGGVGVVSIDGSYIELKRVSVSQADRNNVYANGISIGGTNNLLEDVWVYGDGRYLVQINGSDHVLRRVITRFDYSDGARPQSGFSFYPASNVICENCLTFDYAFGTYVGMAASKVKGGSNNRFYGNIILNTNNFPGFSPQNSGGYSDQNNIYNSVIWDAPVGVTLAGGGGTFLMDQLTVGNANGGAITGYSTRVSKSSIFNQTGAVSANTNDYNIFYNAPVSGNATNVLTSNPGLKYLLRIETNSPAYGSGEGGKHRGANILYRYVNGVETTDPLWPWPYEDRIKRDMCDIVLLTTIGRTGANTPKWCTTNKTLSRYIWEYLGNSCPTGMC